MQEKQRPRLRTWLIAGLFLVVSLAGSALYLLYLRRSTGLGVPFDDSWIHLTLARNLAETGALGIQPGHWSGGSSSLLWDLLLAAIDRLSQAPRLETAIALGAAAQSMSAGLFYLIARDSLGRAHGLVAGALYSFCGPLLLLSLSGMETSLFLLLGMAALWCWGRARPAWSSLFLALLVLTRIEGLVLWAILALCYALFGRSRIPWRAGLGALLPPPIVFLLSSLLRLRMEGQFLPLTMAGRRWLWGVAPGRLPLWPANREAMGVYLRIWKAYLLDWLFQSFLLEPWPALLFIYRTLCLALLLAGLAWLGRIAWRERMEGRRVSGVLLATWASAHFGIYLLFAPIATLRHQVLVLPALFLLAGAGLQLGWTLLQRLLPRPLCRGLWAIGASGLLLVNGIGFQQWKVNYADHVRHINQVHVRLGRWVSANLPEEAVVAAFDIGALSYLGGSEIVDMGGLTDPAVLPYLYAHNIVPCLQARQVTHLAIADAPGSYLWNQLGLVQPALGETARLQRLHEVTIAPYVYPPFDRPADYYYYPASRHIAIYAVHWSPPPQEQGASTCTRSGAQMGNHAAESVAASAAPGN